MPEISVIIPVYNVEKYLNRCIDSILAQTFTDFELILVDDGSPDNCGKICDECSEKDNRIQVIHKENGGLSDARNAGIEWALNNSDSEWITFIDSDDWVHPKYLEALYNAVMGTGLTVSVCDFKGTSGEEPLGDVLDIYPIICKTEDFYCERNINAVIACGKLYRKSDFTDIRYPVGRLHEDEFTTYKILFQYEKIAFINQPLYFYFRNYDSITKSQWSLRRLDGFDAYLIQIDYFYNFGFIDALNHTFECYAYNFKSLEENKNCIENYDIIYKKLLVTLRKMMKKYHPSIKKCPYAFQLAFPRFSSAFWFCSAQMNKFRRKKRA